MTALFHVWLSLTARSLLILGIAALLIVVARTAHARHVVWTVAILCALALPVATNVLPRVGVIVPSQIGRSAVPAAERAASRGPELLAVLWPLGALVVWARFVFGVARLRRVARGARSADQAWHARVRELATSIGVKREVAVLRGSDSVVPVTWGIWRPAILLPPDADAWPPEQQRAILLHELEHIRRHDCLVETIARFTCGLYWINPLMWIGARHLNTLREFACDAAVVRNGVAAADYGSQLIDMARATRIRALPIAPIAFAGGLHDRIRRLGAVEAHAPRGGVVAPLLIVLAFVAISAVDVARADGRWRSHAIDRVTAGAQRRGKVVITMSGHAPMPVTVTTWEYPLVEVTAHKDSDRRGDAAAAAWRAIDITATPSAGGVDVRTIVNEAAGNVRVRLIARVPAQTDLVITTTGGGVHVGDGFSSVVASTEGGPIAIGSTSGSVRAKTGGGDVRVMIPKGAQPAILARTTGAAANASKIHSVLPLRITTDVVNNGLEPYWQIVGRRDGNSGSLEISTGAGIITIGRAQ
jgi:beta-lactamase regulating signal transducer with metallopeptidase domain